MLVQESTLPTFYSGNLTPLWRILERLQQESYKLEVTLGSLARSYLKKRGEGRRKGTEEREKKGKGKPKYKKLPSLALLSLLPSPV